jgi:hypothetical protein
MNVKTMTVGLIAATLVAGIGGTVSGAGGPRDSGAEMAARERAAVAEVELRQVLQVFASHENNYREARLRGMRSVSDAERTEAEAERIQAQEWVRHYGNIVEAKLREVANAERELTRITQRIETASKR